MSGRVNHPGQFSARTTSLFWSVFNERQQEGEKRATEGIVAGGISLGVGFKAFGTGVQAKLEESLKSSAGVSTDRAKELSESLTKRMSAATSDTKGWEDAKTRDAQSGHRSTFDDGRSRDLSSKVDESTKRLEQARQTFSLASDLQQNSGWKNEMDYGKLGNQFGSHSGEMKALDSSAQQRYGALYHTAKQNAFADIDKSEHRLMDDKKKEGLATYLALSRVAPGEALQALKIASPHASGPVNSLSPTANGGLNTDPNQVMSQEKFDKLSGQAVAAGTDASIGPTAAPTPDKAPAAAPEKLAGAAPGKAKPGKKAAAKPQGGGNPNNSHPAVPADPPSPVPGTREKILGADLTARQTERVKNAHLSNDAAATWRSTDGPVQGAARAVVSGGEGTAAAAKNSLEKVSDRISEIAGNPRPTQKNSDLVDKIPK